MKATNLIALGLSLLACTLPAHATELHLQLHGVSHHTQPQANGIAWNQRNTGLGLRAQFTPEWGVQAGSYLNSYYRTTNYVAAQYSPYTALGARVGVFGGYVSGYAHTRLAAGGMSTWQAGNLSATMRFIPAARGGAAVYIFELGVLTFTGL